MRRRQVFVELKTTDDDTGCDADGVGEGFDGCQGATVPFSQEAAVFDWRDQLVAGEGIRLLLLVPPIPLPSRKTSLRPCFRM